MIIERESKSELDSWDETSSFEVDIVPELSVIQETEVQLALHEDNGDQIRILSDGRIFAENRRDLPDVQITLSKRTKGEFDIYPGLCSINGVYRLFVDDGTGKRKQIEYTALLKPGDVIALDKTREKRVTIRFLHDDSAAAFMDDRLDIEGHILRMVPGDEVVFGRLNRWIEDVPKEKQNISSFHVTIERLDDIDGNRVFRVTDGRRSTVPIYIEDGDGNWVEIKTRTRVGPRQRVRIGDGDVIMTIPGFEDESMVGQSQDFKMSLRLETMHDNTEAAAFTGTAYGRAPIDLEKLESEQARKNAEFYGDRVQEIIESIKQGEFLRAREIMFDEDRWEKLDYQVRTDLETFIGVTLRPGTKLTPELVKEGLEYVSKFSFFDARERWIRPRPAEIKKEDGEYDEDEKTLLEQFECGTAVIYLEQILRGYQHMFRVNGGQPTISLKGELLKPEQGDVSFLDIVCFLQERQVPLSRLYRERFAGGIDILEKLNRFPSSETQQSFLKQVTFLQPYDGIVIGSDLRRDFGESERIKNGIQINQTDDMPSEIYSSIQPVHAVVRSRASGVYQIEPRGEIYTPDQNHIWRLREEEFSANPGTLLRVGPYLQFALPK